MLQILKTSIKNLLGHAFNTSANKGLFADAVSPMKKSLYDEIKIVSEYLHDLMLKTTKFVKVNSNLLPIAGISYTDMQLLSRIPNNPILSMSSNVRFGMDRYGQIKVLDFRPGGLMQYVNVATENNNYCNKKYIQSACISPEMLLQSWMVYVINGYRKYLPLRNCILITEDRKEHKFLTYVCRKVGLDIVGTNLDDIHSKGDSVYFKKHKIDVIIRTKSFQDIVKNPNLYHDLFDAMYEKTLIIIDPIEEFIAQSRALQAILWYLYETQQFYTDEEMEFIGTYMLPTYIVPRMDGPAWIMQYFGDEEAKFASFDDVPMSVMEEEGIIYQYRGDMEFAYNINSFLIGNRFAGCTYENKEGKQEYTFVKK